MYASVMSDIQDNAGELLAKPIEEYMNTNVIILEKDQYVDEALRLIHDRHQRSVLVSQLGEVVGIVSKTDILFKVMAQGKNPAKIRLQDIMTSPVKAVNPKNTVQETLDVMAQHVIRQVIVSDKSSVLGMVTRDELFETIHTTTVLTAQEALSGGPVCIINPKALVYVKNVTASNFVCPYCESPFDTAEGMSNHMERAHSNPPANEGEPQKMLE